MDTRELQGQLRRLRLDSDLRYLGQLPLSSCCLIYKEKEGQREQVTHSLLTLTSCIATALRHSFACGEPTTPLLGFPEKAMAVEERREAQEEAQGGGKATS